MDAGGNGKRNAGRYFRHVLFRTGLAPDLPLPFEKIPNLFDVAVRDGPRRLAGPQGAVDRAAAIGCREKADLGTVGRQAIGGFRIDINASTYERNRCGLYGDRSLPCAEPSSHN
jgi:hypothetical protein